MNLKPSQEEIDAVADTYDRLEDDDLDIVFPAVVAYALSYMQADPTSTIKEAIEAGYKAYTEE